ncbi:MAG: cysteine desulfurase-like protein, partial [Propionicimonas sp.]|nr:cysteine desulfurase-like protein [Propionicimonas sp.]
STRREHLEHSFASIHAHETGLREWIETELGRLPGAVLHSRAAQRTPTLLVTVEGRSMAEAYGFLVHRSVLAPAGTFYAHEPWQRLALDDTAGLRIGLAPYTDARDATRLVDGLRAFVLG